MKTILLIPTKLKISFLTLLSVLFIGTYSNAQFTLDGLTYNSGSYTCGSTTIIEPVTIADETDYEITICPSAGEIVYFSFGSVSLNNNGNAAEDDYIHVYEGGTGGTLLYSDGNTNTPNQNFVVTSTTPGACLTIVLQVEDITPSPPSFDATIGCLPAADAGADQSPGDCSTTVTLAGNDVAPATGTWTVSPGGPTLVGGFADTDFNAQYENLLAGTAYTFTWTSDDGTATHSDDMIFNSAGPGCAVYCTDPTPYTNGSDGYISNVNINSGDLSQTSTWGDGTVGYTNNTSCVNIVQGESFTIDITYTATSAFNEFFLAWIDWDGDGVFDTDEEYDLGSSNASTVLNISDAVPCDAGLGSIRIRIAMQYNSAPLPCSSPTTYGEVEDFCFTISAEVPPVATAASVYVPCGTSATLTGTGLPGFWSIISGSGTIADVTDPTTTIDGLLNGSTTLQWTATGNCATDTDQTTFVVSGLPDESISAGTDQFGCFTSAVLEGSDPSPFPGAWSVQSGPGGSSFGLASDPTTTISGLVNGTYVLRWSVTTAVCGVVFDEITITVGSVPPAFAGGDIAACPESASMSADLPAGFVGTWTQTVGPASTITDANDENTLIYDMTAAGTYTYQWEISGGGCPGTTTDFVDIVISACQNLAPIGAGPYTGCNFLFTDDGGAGGNYSDGLSQTVTSTVFCTDDPADFVSMTFTAFDLAPGDYMLIHDSPSPGSPIVGYGTSAGISFTAGSNEALPATLISYTGCLYITFFSNTAGSDPGWEADVVCSPIAGAENTSFVSGDNCGGAGGITVCENGSYPTVNSNAGSPQEIGNGFGPGATCIADGEGNSQWVYFNIVSDGYLEFSVTPAGGQDFDFAIWGPFDGGISCPGFTGDDPIRCTWALQAQPFCPWGSESEGGLAYNSPVATPSAVLPTDVNENIGTCADGPGAEDGWLYPIDALAGEVYVMLIQNYAQNAANWTFAFDDTDPLHAGLGCTPPEPLPLSLLSFSGENVERKNNLYWTTAMQRNNDYFTIEKSSDGVNWEVLSIVEGAGNSNEFLMYEDVDSAPFDVTYYRLIQTDTDGKSDIAKTIVITSESAKEKFTNIFPNPSNGNFYFNYGGDDFNTTIKVDVINSLGQTVLTQEYSEFNQNGALSIDANELSVGFYQVRITQGSIFETQKISVIK